MWLKKKKGEEGPATSRASACKAAKSLLVKSGGPGANPTLVQTLIQMTVSPGGQPELVTGPDRSAAEFSLP